MPKNNTTNNDSSHQSGRQNRVPITSSDTDGNEKQRSYENDVQKAADAINIISLEEVRMSNSETKKVRKQTSGGYDPGPKSGGGYHGGQHVQQQKKYYSASEMRQAREVSRGTSQINMISAGSATDIVRSGHIELDTLYASNNSEVGRKPITVNLVNAPNNSTLQCGCDNISCPFCNLMLSIEQTDPSVLQ